MVALARQVRVSHHRCGEMIIIVYSETNAALIENNLGKSEYSYYFVLKEFLPLLRRLGKVIIVTDPNRDVDVIYHDAMRNSESCVFLSFSPPHQTPLNLVCPTVPVFAWEFDTIPFETWFGERFQDWRFVLNKLGRAITHSTFSAQIVRAAMGPDFPISSIPAPVWDRFSRLRSRWKREPVAHGINLDIKGNMIDSRTINLSIYSPGARRTSCKNKLPSDATIFSASRRIQIDGVVYTSIFNPLDYRKNYFDMLCAFCLVFRDVKDATLIFKIVHSEPNRAIDDILETLYKLTPFKCRVILIDSFLSDTDYELLAIATTYVVNASNGEGQCLPLMEYMSYGKPAISPRHTAMKDYITTNNAFVIDSSPEPTSWPHDPRAAYRTLRQRIDFESLMRAYRESYHVAKNAPERYAAMSKQAWQALKRHCSQELTLERMRAFLATPAQAASTNQDYGDVKGQDAAFYSFGSVIDFVTSIESRRYLSAGWSGTEISLGVWSEGPLAELVFHVNPSPTGSLLLRANLSAFLAATHTDLQVDVSANGIDVARWVFNLAHPEATSHSWREASLPIEIASNNQIRVKLRIDDPKSPWQLGLSMDRRLLGVMIHELSMSLVR